MDDNEFKKLLHKELGIVVKGRPQETVSADLLKKRQLKLNQAAGVCVRFMTLFENVMPLILSMEIVKTSETNGDFDEQSLIEMLKKIDDLKRFLDTSRDNLQPAKKTKSAKKENELKNITAGAQSILSNLRLITEECGQARVPGIPESRVDQLREEITKQLENINETVQHMKNDWNDRFEKKGESYYAFQYFEAGIKSVKKSVLNPCHDVAPLNMLFSIVQDDLEQTIVELSSILSKHTKDYLDMLEKLILRLKVMIVSEMLVNIKLNTPRILKAADYLNMFMGESSMAKSFIVHGECVRHRRNLLTHRLMLDDEEEEKDRQREIAKEKKSVKEGEDIKGEDEDVAEEGENAEKQATGFKDESEGNEVASIEIFVRHAKCICDFLLKYFPSAEKVKLMEEENRMQTLTGIYPGIEEYFAMVPHALLESYEEMERLGAVNGIDISKKDVEELRSVINACVKHGAVNGIDISKKDVEELRSGDWLSDAVINACVKQVRKPLKRSGSIAVYLSWWNTQTPSIDRTKKLHLFPTILSGHWWLILAENQDQSLEIFHFDSIMQGDEERYEEANKRLSECFEGKKTSPRIMPVKEQKGTKNCGVHLIYNAWHLLQNENPKPLEVSGPSTDMRDEIAKYLESELKPANANKETSPLQSPAGNQGMLSEKLGTSIFLTLSALHWIYVLSRVFINLNNFR